ncbi:hypothetical protein, partial [Streptomyces sp. McG6]|uniref:hypothetical protein n=1 Tax=Streptomyces sp. McG6 TaxID=2725485 RepID=UPI00203764F3
VYDLTEELLLGGTVKGLTISGNADQIHLQRQAPLLEEFVRRGGRVLVNGHIVRPFLPGLTPWRALDHRGPADLVITPVTPHPVFEGVDPAELLYRTGVPGTPTGEELTRVGVAGFYGRGYQTHLPEGATVLNGIGPHALPVDVVHPLGRGQVMVHAGNDLLSFCDPDRSTRHRFGNATLADFLDNLASATDRDVHTWAAAWLRTSGVDTLTAHATDT